MRALLAMTLSAMALALAAPAAAQQAAPAPSLHANAFEQAPAALLGAWKADVAASKYAGTPPRANYRTFAYTDGGKVLVSSMTLGATGRQSMLHWAVALDGSPAPEFTSGNRSIPSSVVGLKKQDETTLVMTVWQYGKVTLTGSFKLSPDGGTLTYTYGAKGDDNVITYKKWDMVG